MVSVIPVTLRSSNNPDTAMQIDIPDSTFSKTSLLFVVRWDPIRAHQQAASRGL